MENELRLPQKGDNPFSSKNSGFGSSTWCSLSWFPNFNLDDSFYASAFKKAGDKIIDGLERTEDGRNADSMFLPIAYLYRHCLELKLKSVIRRGIDLEIIEIEDKKYNEIMESHNLHIIWNLFKSIVLKHWQDADRTPIESAEKVILEIHKVDQNGQNLKYSKDRKGNKTSQYLPKKVELINFKGAIECVYNLFDCCELEFTECMQMRDEMNSEYKKLY